MRKYSRATKDDRDPCTRSRRQQARWCHGIGGPTCGDRRSYIRVQETGALGAGELALSGTHAHAAVHPVCQSKLQGRAHLVFENVLASVKEVRFVCPGWPQEAFPVCFVENGDGSAPAS